MQCHCDKASPPFTCSHSPEKSVYDLGIYDVVCIGSLVSQGFVHLLDILCYALNPCSYLVLTRILCPDCVHILIVPTFSDSCTPHLPHD